LSRPHFAFFADRAFGDVNPGEPEQCFLSGLLDVIVFFGPTSKELATGGKLLLAASVTQKAVMPDFHEPVRKDMKQEPPDELIGIHGHDLVFVVIGVVAPPERDLIAFKLHEPVIADRDPVCVSAEIIKNVVGSCKWLLTVNNPLLLV
jgi:hypothetical protein